MERTTTVFLSSTQGGLGDYRDAVYEAINNLDYYRCIRMEDFGARNEASLSLCVQKVKQCDCFVALIGPFYGSCPEGEERSYSEIEYETAVESDRTRFVFVCPNDFPVPADQVENEKKRKKQRAFRARVEKERQRASFASPGQAVQSVLTALFNWQSSRPVEEGVEVNRATQLKEPAIRGESIHASDSYAPDESTQQRSEAVDILAGALKSGEVDFREHDSEALDAFHVVRAFLSIKTLFGRRCADELLTTHEMNVLYRYRQRLSPGGWENKLIWRSLIGDSFGVVPGWYWFHFDQPKVFQGYLWHTALRDAEPSVKAHSIQLLAMLHSRPIPELFDERNVFHEIASTTSPEVQKSLLEYFAENGIEQDLAYVETLSHSTDPNVNDVIERTRWKIKVAHNPNDALVELMSTDSPAATALVWLKEEGDQLSIELLEKAIAHKSAGLRKLATEVLIDRKTLSKDAAYALLKQDLVQLRAQAFVYLISLGERFAPEQIREALKEPDDSTSRLYTLSLLLGGVDVDSVIHALYKSYTYEELLAEIDWFSISGPIAYRVMAECHFTKASDRIRQDLDNRFESLRKLCLDKAINEMREGLRKELKDLPVAIQDKAIEKASQQFREEEQERLTEFMRGRYIAAALLGIAPHCEQQDLQIARRYLNETRTEYYGEVEASAANIVARLGDTSDVPLLLSVAKQMHGDKRQSVLVAAIKYSLDVARELLQEDSAHDFRLAAESLLAAKDPDIRSLLEKHLVDESESKRQTAVAFLVKTCSTEELTQLLERYLEQGRYFYNVVCWLDKVLFAPESLKPIYTKQLMKTTL